MAIEAFIIDPKDNVGTLFIQDGTPGKKIAVQVSGKPAQLELRENVPFAHKFAIRRISKGDQVIKYGYSIGTATVDIEPGQHVHIHNTESNRGRGDLAAGQSPAAGGAK
jgi:altronate dehydratase small subunit